VKEHLMLLHDIQSKLAYEMSLLPQNLDNGLLVSVATSFGRIEAYCYVASQIARISELELRKI
jgi:hypothetical protein